MVIYPHFIPNFENYMVMYPYFTPNMETTRGSIPILFTILWTTWEHNPQDISKIGNNMGEHSQDFPSPGIHSKVEPFSQKKPICVIMWGINLPIFSHTRNFLSQVFHISGKKSQKIPKWESKKVSCAQGTFCNSQIGKKMVNLWVLIGIWLVFPKLGKCYQNQSWV